MSIGRLVGILIALAVVLWLFNQYKVLSPAASGPAAGAPMQKAKELQNQTQNYNSSLSQAAQEAAQAGTGGPISDNMTPEQVRALLGPPDDIQTDTTELGKTRERWSYRAAGRTVVFENGIVVAVQ